MAPVVLEAADILAEQEISAEVVSFHTVKPLDETYLAHAFTNFGLVVTVEEHSVLGGFGASVAEWICGRHPRKARLLTLGTGDHFLHEAGDQLFARTHFGLTAEAIARRTHDLHGEMRGGSL